METYSFDSVMSRFAKAVGLESDKAIAECLGMSPTAYSNRKQRGSIPYDELIEYLHSHNMDIGRMLSPGTASYEITPSSVQPVLYKRTNYESDEFAAVSRYNIQVAAGHGAINGIEEQLHPLAFRRDWLATRHLSPDKLVIVDVSGNSMEPYLKDGDMVLVDRSQTTVTSGKTYVLRIDGHLLVKNLQLLPQGMVQVCSFNAGFAPYQVDLSNEALDMAVIGRVVASMHEW
jgi:phage repressor protein C with HTH and peptisase S24 domain